MWSYYCWWCQHNRELRTVTWDKIRLRQLKISSVYTIQNEQSKCFAISNHHQNQQAYYWKWLGLRNWGQTFVNILYTNISKTISCRAKQSILLTLTLNKNISENITHRTNDLRIHSHWIFMSQSFWQIHKLPITKLCIQVEGVKSV